MGAYIGSASAYGTFDQNGNVWEWNEAIPYVYGSYTYRGLRGGSFYGDYGLQSSFRGYAIGDPSGDYDFNVGFRVVQLVPEPLQSSHCLAGWQESWAYAGVRYNPLPFIPFILSARRSESEGGLAFLGISSCRSGIQFRRSGIHSTKGWTPNKVQRDAAPPVRRSGDPPIVHVKWHDAIGNLGTGQAVWEMCDKGLGRAQVSTSYQAAL